MSLLKTMRQVVAELPDAAAGDLAEQSTKHGAVFALLADPKRGDVSYNGGGGLGADRWGAGTSYAKAARRLIEASTGCLIGVRRRSEEIVIDPVNRNVRRGREVISLPRSMRASVPSRDKAAKSLPATEPIAAVLPSRKSALLAVLASEAEEMRLQADLVAKQRAIHALDQRRTKAERTRARAMKELTDAATTAVMAGRELEDQSAIRSAILSADAEIAACTGAIPAAREAIRAAEKALTGHAAARAYAVLDLTCIDQDAELASAQKAVAGLKGALARLVAPNIVRERLLGERFARDPARHNIFGAPQLVAAFLEALPPRLRSEKFTLEAILRDAAQVADAAMAELQSHTKE